MRATRCPTTCRSASSPHGSGFLDGSSTTFVSSRPSISTFVVTNRLAIRVALVRDGQDGANDFRIRPAAAEIPAHAAFHLVFGRVRVGVQQRRGGEDLAWRAEAALQRIVFDERGLEWTERLVSPDPFDRGDLSLCAGCRERQARIRGTAVE